MRVRGLTDRAPKLESENPLSTIPQSSKDPDSTFANMSERWPNVTSSSNIQANQVQRIRGSPCGGNLITGFWEQCHFPPSFPTPRVLHHIDWSFMLFTCRTITYGWCFIHITLSSPATSHVCHIYMSYIISSRIFEYILSRVSQPPGSVCPQHSGCQERETKRNR